MRCNVVRRELTSRSVMGTGTRQYYCERPIEAAVQARANLGRDFSRRFLADKNKATVMQAMFHVKHDRRLPMAQGRKTGRENCNTPEDARVY